MRRSLCLAAIIPVALAIAGCATMTVGSYVERGLDLTQYDTYNWGTPDALPTRDPRFDENPFFNDQLQGAVEKQLAAKGFGQPTSDAPDLLIHYHANISRRIDVNNADLALGYSYDEESVPVVEFETGTLVIDLLDARTNRLLWRGWARHGVEDMLADPDKMAQRIDQAVSGILARFPGGAAGASNRPPTQTGGNQ
jgi:hypothetical protein